MKAAGLLLICCMCLFATFTQAQNPGTDLSDTSKYVVTKFDGKKYHGFILSDDGREIYMQTDEVGKIYILKSDLKRMEQLLSSDKRVGLDTNKVSPFYTRYCFSHNAFPFKKGEHYTVINAYGPEIHFAVRDRLSIGFVSTWLISPMVLSARYSFRKKESDVNFSISSYFGTSSYLNQFKGYGGMHWLSSTFGTKENSITLSAGYLYLQTGDDYFIMPDGTYSGSYPPYQRIKMPMSSGAVFMLGGSKKTGDYTSLIFDFMVTKYSRQEYDVNSNIISYAYYDSVDVYHPAVYEYSTQEYELKATLFVGMIGMRYQKVKNRAFQVSLSGISLVSERQDNGVPRKHYVNIPVPMFTWLFRI